MSTRARIVLIALPVLLLATVVGIWFLHNFERRSIQLPVPAYGEPTFNPLYALREAIRRDGGNAESRRRLDLPAMALQPGDTVLMLDDPRQLTPTQVDQLLDWVQFGGHLLLQVPSADAELDGSEHGLLERLGVLTTDRSPRCLVWQVPDQPSHNEFCSGSRFRLEGSPRVERQWGDAAEPHDEADEDDGSDSEDNAEPTLAWARLRYGVGRIDLLGETDFLRNGAGSNSYDTGLRDLPHRDLARLMLAPNYGKGTVHLIYEMQLPSLWHTLLKRGWPVWLPLLLALLAWLWMRSQRFGAQLPSPRGERRSLLEHVRASGEHLHRFGKSPLLYEAVRQSFLARLRRRAPVAAALSGDAQAQAIADHLQWPISRVQTAMQVPPSRDDTALRERIRLLIQMRNQL